MLCYSRATVYAYVPNIVSIGLFCHPLLAKKAQFCRFWTYSVVANWQQSDKVDKKPNFAVFGLIVLSPIGNNLTKLNTGAQLQTFPYPMASKSFLYSNAFMTKSGAQSLTFKKRDEQTDRQTDKQTKNSTFLATPAAGEIPVPPNLAW